MPAVIDSVPWCWSQVRILLFTSVLLWNLTPLTFSNGIEKENVGVENNTKKISHILKPVSYTHLDVYKRQVPTITEVITFL